VTGAKILHLLFCYLGMDPNRPSVLCSFVLSCSLHSYVCKVQYICRLQSTCRMFMGRRSLPTRTLPAAASKLTKPRRPCKLDGAAETDYVLGLGRRMAMLVRNGTWRRGDANPWCRGRCTRSRRRRPARRGRPGRLSDTTTAGPNDVSVPALGC
jgi:hypothetical protein